MLSNDAAAIDTRRGDEPMGSTARSWLRDHLVAAVAVAVTLLTAAGYCVHRSWLFGWYQAAGIPAFAHGWAAQDVVMQGVTNLTVWLVILVSVVLMTIAIYIELVAISAAERWWSRRRAARRQRRSEQLESEHAWTRIGAHAAVCGMVVAGAMLLLSSIALAIYLFSSVPRKLGNDQFLEMNKYAETTMRAIGASSEADSPTAESAKEAEIHMQMRYRYVIASVGLGDEAKRYCGWLVLQNGEHMLLLTREGPLFLSASGVGFSWTPTKIERC